MKTFFLVVALVLNACFLTAQNEIKISGTVVEDSSLIAVPFATVSVNKMATLSDIDGRFSFTIAVNKADTVSFSCIGYENKTISAQNFLRGEQTVMLTQKVYELRSDTIYGWSTGTILEKAIRKIPEAYAVDTFYQSGFYRQYHEENNKYVRLIEAVVTLENRVKKNNTQLKGKERMALNHLRRSAVYEQNDEKHGDHLTDLLSENPAYHSTGTVLNLKALRSYRFYFDTTNTWPDSIYHIYYYSTDRTGQRFDRGEIFIDADDFIILKIIKEDFSNTRAIRRERTGSSGRYRWDFLSSKLVAEYKMKNGKMHTASLNKIYTHELYDNVVRTKDFTVTECFELTLDIELPPKLPQTSFSEFSDLYHRRYSYDDSFWKNFPAVDFHFRKAEDVKRDLEKDIKLEKQFAGN